MKKINKIMLWFLIIFFSIFILVNIAVSLFAKPILVQQLEKNLKLHTSLGSISVGLPFSINLNNLEIGDLFRADQISVTPNIFGFFAGKIILSNMTLVNPVIKLEQANDGSLSLPRSESKDKPGQKQKQKQKAAPIYLTSLIIKNGKLTFIDRKIDPTGYKIILGKINANISKVMLPPSSLKTNFNVALDFLNPDAQKLGGLNFSGWIDFGLKDMDGALSVKDLDLTYFSPYYGNFISSKKLLSARINISAFFKSKNNALDIATNFRLSDLTYAPQEEQPEGELPEFSLAQNALDLFTDKHGNLILDFNISTKLDNPNITIGELEKVILKAAAKNLSRQSPETLIKKVSDNIEQFKAIGKNLESIFKGE
ncbi:MAG: DUF748 domain-containing protein [Candidatus Omnitrophica bacterium]|nr:DUF748 domain-containing protein [Candidatus Omnitrophota bacterium]MDD5026979.1 DUF748 domain-containing protein [Candidatus Omnitrophota bacterium]MDD5661657.1 DUF748 domain-containing protein [Candidatus Omnitrophota bacterium]